MKATTVGTDLAKNVFQLHGVNEFGKTVLKKQLRRDQMAEYFVKLMPLMPRRSAKPLPGPIHPGLGPGCLCHQPAASDSFLPSAR